MNPLDNVAELYERAPAVVARVVGATNYVHHIEEGEILGTHLPCVKAWFSPQTRVVTVNPAVTKRLAAFFLATSSARRRTVKPNEATQRWDLALVKTDLVALTATLLKGNGPEDERLMRMEWNAPWQYPHGHTVANGVPQALALRIVDTVATELGVVARDRRFAEVDPLQMHYATQAGIVEAVAGDVAEGRGGKVATELVGMVRAGSGHLALWSLARRFSGVAEFDAADVLDRPAGWVELRKALDAGFAGITTDWTNGDGPEFSEPTESPVDYWQRVIFRDLRSAVRRVKAGPGQEIDVGKFAVAIGAAGEAGTAEVDTSMDFLQTVWLEAESVDTSVGA